MVGRTITHEQCPYHPPLVDFRQYVLKRMDCESEEEALDAVKEVPPAPE